LDGLPVFVEQEVGIDTEMACWKGLERYNTLHTRIIYSIEISIEKMH
jgi:hypothetical protein